MKKKDFGARLEHVGIHVYNMAETMKFYHEVFGFELVLPDFEDDYLFVGGVFPKTCTMRLGTFELEIYEVQHAEAFSFVDYEFNIGVKHLSFEIEDVFGWIEYIKERGDIEIKVENYYGKFGCTVYILDNSGMLVEVTDVRKKFPLYKNREDRKDKWMKYVHYYEGE